jgi:hypothetical protein
VYRGAVLLQVTDDLADDGAGRLGDVHGLTIRAVSDRTQPIAALAAEWILFPAASE